MSLSLSVNIKGKRVTVKASPATPLTQVLNDACKQAACDSSQGYILTYNGKELDRSLPCRLLGLVSGAKLEAKQQSTTALVRVALQLPSNERVQHQFSSADTLAHILQHIGFQYTDTTRLNYLNTEVPSHRFESTTLDALGLTQGSGLLRIIASSSSVLSPSSPPQNLPSSPPSNPSSSPSSPQTTHSPLPHPPDITASNSNPSSPATVNNSRSPTTTTTTTTTAATTTPVSSPPTSASNTRSIISDSNPTTHLPPRPASPAAATTTTSTSTATTSNDGDVHMEDILANNHNNISTLPIYTSTECNNNNNVNDNLNNHYASNTMNSSTNNNNNNIITNNDKNMTVTNKPVNNNNNSTNNNSNVNNGDASIHAQSRDEYKYTIPERNLQIFLPTEVAATPKYDVPESFYAHTAEDAQQLARMELRRKQEQLDSRVLKTKAMRDREAAELRLNKVPKFSKTVIRVRFPDRVELQAEFAPHEEISSLLQIVRENLLDQNSFYLYITPPVQKLEKGTLESLGLCPSALVLFSRTNKDTTPPFLKPLLKPVLKHDPANDEPSPSSSSISTSAPLGSAPTITTTTATTTTTTTSGRSEASKKEMEARMMAKYFGKKK